MDSGYDGIARYPTRAARKMIGGDHKLVLFLHSGTGRSVSGEVRYCGG